METSRDLDRPTLTTREFAALCGIARPTFYAWIKRGLIPAHLRAPIPRRWSRRLVEEWLATGAPAESHTPNSTETPITGASR